MAFFGRAVFRHSGCWSQMETTFPPSYTSKVLTLYCFCLTWPQVVCLAWFLNDRRGTLIGIGGRRNTSHLTRATVMQRSSIRFEGCKRVSLEPQIDDAFSAVAAFDKETFILLDAPGPPCVFLSRSFMKI